MGLIQAPTEEDPVGVDGGGGVGMLTPSVHRRALSPVPGGDGAGLQVPLPGSALNPVAAHLCCSFLLRAKPLCSLPATQSIQGRVSSATKGSGRKHTLPHHRSCSKWPFRWQEQPRGPKTAFTAYLGFASLHPASLLPSGCLCIVYWCTHHIPCVHVRICVYMYA